MPLDVLDRKILFEMDTNSRIHLSQLAKKVKRSRDTVNFRVTRLMREGYIKSTYTIFNTAKLGWYYYKIYIKYRNITPEQESSLIGFVEKQPYVAYLASVEGYYDCIILVMARSPEGLAEFLDPFIDGYGKSILEKEIVSVLNVHRYNARFLYPEGRLYDFTYASRIENAPLFPLDNALLKRLSNDARASVSDIARDLKTDYSTVHGRIKALEQSGIILGYTLAIDLKKLGLSYYQVNISLQKASEKRAIRTFFEGKGCYFALELAGRFDLTIELAVPSSESLHALMNEFREKFVDSYTQYDICRITAEHRVVWGPFESKTR